MPIHGNGESKSVPAILLDIFDSGSNPIFGQHPFRVRQTTHQAEFEPLVNVLRPLIVAKDIGGEGQCQLGGTATRVSPFKTLGVIPQIASRMERITFAVLLDINRAAVCCSPSVINLHAANEW